MNSLPSPELLSPRWLRAPWCVATLAPILWAAVGCSAKDENRKRVFPVQGKVFVNKKPATGAFVLFVPVKEPAEPKDPRPRADVEEDGSFKLSTYDINDGAPPGDYVVLVTWTARDGPDEREDILKGRYNDPKQPQLRATVREEATELPPFQLK